MSTSLHGGDRRLSPLRVIIGIVIVLAIAAGSVFALQTWNTVQAEAQDSEEPWFAGYVDVTATPVFPFETPTTDKGSDVMLSFIVALEEEGAEACTPSWGTAYTMDEASSVLNLDRRIARLQQQGGGAAISFGGLDNAELATACTDRTKLTAAYASVVERYGISTIDLDIEGNDLDDTRAGVRRAAAIADLQAQRRAIDKPLAVWLTLPAATFGLTEEGTTAVAQMIEAGVDIAGVNIMTMNFGQSLEAGESLAAASERALESTHRQLKSLYALAEVPLSDGTIWSKLGATPMIGQNDVKGEIFTLADATALNAYALTQGLGRMSMWSLNRDVTCGANYVDLKRVSDSCSGVAQGDERFAHLLGTGFEGTELFAAGRVTTSEPIDPSDLTDDPETSPYPIWSEDASYLKGTKITWHRNVFEAKWWTRGELPDNPVLNEWETPWTLIGPVLPGEKPVAATTLPDGTFPTWSGAAVYEKGTRVLFDGIPFEAKWWNQAESPEAASSEPDSSPWVPLTATEIAAIVRGLVEQE